MSDRFQDLLASDRVGARTRRVLLARARADDPGYVPTVLSVTELMLLRAVVARIIPQGPQQVGGASIDLAARIDAALTGPGDGWRVARLPPDPIAYRAALTTLAVAAQANGGNFAELGDERQDQLLRHVAAGRLEIGAAPPEGLDAARMALWFADLCADAVRLYVAHPATLARMGYSGMAHGGDGEPKAGFVRLGAGEREGWEPDAAVGPGR